MNDTIDLNRSTIPAEMIFDPPTGDVVLPPEHDDPNSPFYVPEHLRAEYLRVTLHRDRIPDARSTWAEHKAKLRYYGRLDDENGWKPGTALEQAHSAGRMFFPRVDDLDALIQDFTDKDRRMVSHLARLAESIHAHQVRMKTEHHRKAHTCDVCGLYNMRMNLVDRVMPRDFPGVGSRRACGPCARLLTGELEAAQKLPNGCTRADAVADVLRTMSS